MEYFSSNLTFLRKKAGKNQDEVAKSLNFASRSRYTNYEKGHSSPDLKTLIELSKYFDIAIDDLLNVDLSKSNYLTNTNKALAVAEPKEDYGIKQGLPLIPIDAMAGYSKGEADVYLEAERYVVPDFQNKADYLIKVFGTSMSPKYYNGDVVACKKIPKDTFIQWGKVYVMDTVQGALCKRLFESKNEGYISVVSDNKEYPAFEMPKKEIRSLAIVIGVIRLE